MLEFAQHGAAGSPPGRLHGRRSGAGRRAAFRRRFAPPRLRRRDLGGERVRSRDRLERDEKPVHASRCGRRGAAAGVDPRRTRPAGGGFLFLLVFDFLSTVERKNPLGLVEAFRRAFPARRRAAARAQERQRRHTTAELARGSARRRRPPRHPLVDALRLPASRERAHRAPATATSRCTAARGSASPSPRRWHYGKPVIATGYSGNLEFMDDENSYLVRYDLRPYRRGRELPGRRVWAEPDLDHAAH